MKVWSALIFGALVLGAGAASAATLSNVSPGLVIRQPGQAAGFAQGANGAQVNPGAFVVANNGSGNVVFPDGCTVNVPAGATFEVPAVSPCNTTPPPSTDTVARIVGVGAAGGAVAVGASVLFRDKKQQASGSP